MDVRPVTRDFVRVFGVGEIDEWRARRVTLNGVDIVLFRCGDAIAAIENLCPHQRFSRFHDAVCRDRTVRCPMHGWSFDVHTGAAVEGGGSVRVFEVRIDGADVSVRVPGPSAVDSMTW